ncbi:MAG: tryptophan synthase subunit alpha [Tissierellia bacterium]|nr:tryptophan synthase subunit alpha [Tissierellia bacterium]
MNNLDKFFNSGNKALTLFMTLFYPEKEKFFNWVDILVENGMDILEIGIPVQNPIMDGEVIRKSYGKVLENNIQEDEIISALQTIKKKHPNLPIVIMSYYEGIKKYNLFDYGEYYDGILCPDRFLVKENNDVNIIQIYHEEMDDSTIKKLLANNDGFAYVLSGKGSTGGRCELSLNYKITMNKIRRSSSIPIQIGFGIYEAEQIEKLLQSNVDGAIIGSEIIRKIENGNKDLMKDYIKELKTVY